MLWHDRPFVYSPTGASHGHSPGRLWSCDPDTWPTGGDPDSGVYAPLPTSIGLLRYISELSPATYVLRGVRSALIDGTGPDWGEVAILVAMACFFIPVGLWGFGRAERYAKRTGKLKRVG